MEQLKSHFTAMQAAAATSIVTAAILALPLFAAEQSPVQAIWNESDAAHLVSVFEKTGAETVGTFGNRSIDDSGFDFAAYKNNVCFSPTETDIPACKREFNAYADLRQTYKSGQLNAILRTVPYLAGSAHFAPSGSMTQQTLQSSSSSGNGVQYVTPSQEALRERSVTLWNVCSKLHLTQAATVRCYQRNIRRTQEWSNPFDTSSVY